MWIQSLLEFFDGPTITDVIQLVAPQLDGPATRNAGGAATNPNRVSHTS